MQSSKCLTLLTVITLAVSGIWLPSRIPLAHANTIVQSPNLIGPVINTGCTASTLPCQINLPPGPNPNFTATYTTQEQTTYLYAATDEGSNSVSWLPCCQTSFDYIGLDLSVANQRGVNSVILGHSFGNESWASYSNNGLLIPIAGGLGVIGTYSEAFSFNNQGQTSIAGSFSLPTSALVVLVSAGSNLGRFISATGPFGNNGASSTGGSIMYGHASLSSGLYSFSLNFQQGNDLSAAAVGVMLYVFASQSLAVPFSMSMQAVSNGPPGTVLLTSGSVTLGSMLLPLTGSSVGGQCESGSSSDTDTLCLAPGTYFNHTAGTKIQVGNYFMSVGACYSVANSNTLDLTFVPGWPPYCSGPTQVTLGLGQCTIRRIDLPGSCAITGQILAIVSATGTFTYLGGQATINAQGTAVETFPGGAKLSSTNTSVNCSPSTIQIGSSTKCIATVTGSSSPPTGTVTFTSSSSTGTFTPSKGQCTLSAGSCSVTYSDITAASPTITAAYQGDPNNVPSAGSTTLTVSVGNVAFSDNFSEAALNITRWWEDSSVVSNIASFESQPIAFGKLVSVPTLNDLSLAFPTAMSVPSFSSGAQWTLSSRDTLFGITSRDAFTPPFTAIVETTVSGISNGGNPVALFLTNGDTSVLFGVFLGNFLAIQNGATHPSEETSFNINPGERYSVIMKVGVAKIDLMISGPRWVYSNSFAIATVSDYAYFLSLATFRGSVAGTSSSSPSGSVVYHTVTVTSGQNWSLSVSLESKLSIDLPPNSSNGLVTLTNVYNGRRASLPTKNGIVTFSGLVTGMYQVNASISQGTATFSTIDPVQIGTPGDPQNPNVLDTLVVEVRPPSPLAISLDPGGTQTILAGKSETIIAVPYGGNGTYSITWSLNSNPLKAGDPCTSTENSLTCTNLTPGTYFVMAQATAGQIWFSSPLPQSYLNPTYLGPVSSTADTIIVQPADYCAGTNTLSTSQALNVTLNYDSASCQTSGAGYVLLQLSTSSVSLNTTISNNYPGSIPVPRLDPRLTSALGINYPWYGIFLDGTDTHYVMQLDDQQNVTLAFPANTAINNLHFTITLSPTSTYAELQDLVIAGLDAIGFVSALKAAEPDPNLFHAILKEFEDALGPAIYGPLLMELSLLPTANPATFSKVVLQIVQDSWNSFALAFKNVAKIILNKWDVKLEAFLAGLATSILLSAPKAIADYFFDLTSILVTVLRGDSSTTFALQPIIAGNTLTTITVDPTNALPSATAFLTQGTYGWNGTAWISPSRGFVHSTFTSNIYSFVVPGGNFTLNIASPTSSPANYTATISSGDHTTTIKNFLSAGNVQRFWIWPTSATIIVAGISVSELFADSKGNLLPRDSLGNPMVSVVLPNGQVRSTNPGQVLVWTNATNTGLAPLQSLKMSETLPVDWAVFPAWMMPSMGAINVTFVFANGTRLNITNQTKIIVRTGNPETVSLTIANITATAAGKPLATGDSILVSVKLRYALIGTSQSFSSYPRNYYEAASAFAWMQPSFRGGQASANSTAFFTADAKIVS